MNAHTSSLAVQTVSTPARPRSARWRMLVGAAALLGCWLAGSLTPASAAPPASCKTMIQNLAATNYTLRAVQTTNYKANGLWATATADGTLGRFQSGALYAYAGWIPRVWSTGTQEYVYVEVYADGSVRFNSVHGPYPAQCVDEKFLTVNTWDSFETFTFGPHLIQ